MNTNLLTKMPSERLILGLFAVLLVCLAAYNSTTRLLPNSITIPGIIAGLVLSYLVPALQGKPTPMASLGSSILGLLAGAIFVYGLSLAGKALFGKEKRSFETATQVSLSETGLVLADGEIPYEEIFYRASDKLEIDAASVHVRFTDADGGAPRDFGSCRVILSPTQLLIGDDAFNLNQIARLDTTTHRIYFPREVIGFGLVKLAALVGVFLGWQGVLFAIGCGGTGLGLGYLLSVTIGFPYGQNIDAASPMCIASLFWIFLRSNFALAAGLAIALATTASLVIEYWTTRRGQ